ncbi:MAG: tRNA1(Val) (adenine(37)-N6)-methyltransferase [Bacillota bacterium]
MTSRKNKSKEVEIKAAERIDDLLIDGLKLIQNPNHFCFSLDAVLLADFVNPTSRAKVLDLGTGTGIIPHLIQAKYSLEQVYGIDIQPQMIDMAVRSAKYNDLTAKLEFMELDLRNALDYFGTETFDYIISNPPYLKEGSGKVNPQESIAIARHELKCKLEDIVKVSNQLVKYGGSVAYIYRAKRLAELIAVMEKYNLTCKRMRLIHSTKNDPANLVLVEAKKGGGTNLEVVPPLYIYDSNGDYTAEIQEIYYPEE